MEMSQWNTFGKLIHTKQVLIKKKKTNAENISCLH
jgi:hypothetical protein